MARASIDITYENLGEFARDMQNDAEMIGEDIHKLLGDAYLQLGKVVPRTPRDTGRAQQSWNFSAGQPDEHVPGAGEYTEPAWQQEAKDVVDKLAGTNFPDLFITSGLEYMPALEHGHSQQAPAGMVAVTVAETEQWLESQTQQLNNKKVE